MSNSIIFKLFEVCEAEEASIAEDDARALEALIQAVTEYPTITSLFGEMIEGRTLLSLCCGSGKTNSALFILDYASESASLRDRRDMMPLHWAAGTGDLVLVQRVHQAYPSAIDMVTLSGQTPLYFAIDSEAPEVVEYLISEGVTVTQSLVDSCVDDEFSTERSTRVNKLIHAAM